MTPDSLYAKSSIAPATRFPCVQITARDLYPRPLPAEACARALISRGAQPASTVSSAKNCPVKECPGYW